MRNSTLFKKAEDKGLRPGYYDIESSPHKLAGYALFNQNFSTEQILEPGKITSISFLKGHDKTPTTIGWDFNHATGRGCDKNLLIAFSKWVQDIDLLIGQNSDSFDWKWINWRLNVHDLPPIKNVSLSLDTLKLSRKVFRPPSHKLDYRSTVYGFGGKISQTMRQILAVMAGNEKEQAERMRYNAKDTLDTRKLFFRELDAYELPKKIENILLSYTKEERPFCMKCASQRQKRFDVERFRTKIKGTNRYRFKFACLRCDAVWNVPTGFKFKGVANAKS